MAIRRALLGLSRQELPPLCLDIRQVRKTYRWIEEEGKDPSFYTARVGLEFFMYPCFKYLYVVHSESQRRFHAIPFFIYQ